MISARFLLIAQFNHSIFIAVQSTFFISTSFISTDRLSRSENLVPVLTRKSSNR